MAFLIAALGLGVPYVIFKTVYGFGLAAPDVMALSQQVFVNDKGFTETLNPKTPNNRNVKKVNRAFGSIPAQSQKLSLLGGSGGLSK